jgi:hypothetical protein
VQLRKPQREWYKVHVVCEFDDESEMHDTIELEDLLDDELYFLVLCYIFNWDDEFVQVNPKDEDEAVSGYKVAEDTNFSWLKQYLLDVGLAFGEPEYKIESVFGRDIFYYDGKEKCKLVLPGMKELFNSREEMVEYMNNLYNKTLTNES